MDFGLAVWSHNVRDFGNKEEINRHVERLANADFDILVPCVKNPPGAVDFLTDVAEINPEYPDWDPLRIIIDACRAVGIKVHTWLCVFREGSGSRLLDDHPEFAAKVPDVDWACACRDEVREYEYRLFESIVENYHPDGLHLDYIRTGEPCRCEFCRREMLDMGIKIDDLKWTPWWTNDSDLEVWTKWRTSNITDFVKRIHGLTEKEGLELSAAVFAGYPDCIYIQGQDWVHWAELGLVDFLFPMNYATSYRYVVTRTISHLALVAGRAQVWEGLPKVTEPSKPQILPELIGGVRDAGAQGVIIFHYPFLTDGDLKEIKRIKSDI